MPDARTQTNLPFLVKAWISIGSNFCPYVSCLYTSSSIESDSDGRAISSRKLFPINSSFLYLNSISVAENYRRRRLGSKLTEFMIEKELKKCKKYMVFLLVAKCEQYKLQFFSKLGFFPVKLRETKLGTHCIMCYPFNENSERNCQRLFDYFNWREKKREFISSDCKYAYNPNPTGLYWCAKKNIYVSGLEKQSCHYYVKEKELHFEEKFLDLSKNYCEFW